MSQPLAPLRFAVMLQNEYLKQWQFDVVDNLVQSKTAVPVLLIYNSGTQVKDRQKVIKKPVVLWRLYEKYFLRKGPLSNVLLKDEFIRIPRISCQVMKQGKFSEYFNAKDIETIRTYRPDFILRFGFSIIRGDILDAAPFGIWSFHHSDEQSIRGGPAGFWEVYNGHKINGVILQRLTKHLDGGIILKKRFYKTTLHNCALNLHHILSSSTDMPVQVCRDILNGQADYFQKSPSDSTAKIFTWPKSATMIRFFAKQIFRRIVYNFKDLFIHEKWAVGVAKADFYEITKSGLHELDIQTYCFKSNSTYPADPFALPYDNGIRIFFENFNYKNGKAGIDSVIYDDTSGFSSAKKITDNQSHHSFPFVFRQNNKTYLVPEQIAKGRVDLYTWDENNKALHFERTLLDIPLADPALIFYRNTWWLFGSIAGSDVNNSLNIYYSDTIDGIFTEHSQNSVVFDPRGARMAGLYDSGEKLYRFAQESHITYGRTIRIFEVADLSETSYSEKNIARLVPFNHRNFRKGIHTLSICSPYIVFDGKKYVFSGKGFLLRLKSKIRNRRNHV